MSFATLTKSTTLTACALVAGVFMLTACSSQGDAPEPKKTEATKFVDEDGNGRFNPMESMDMPTSVADITDYACAVAKEGTITQVQAQMVQGFGVYIGQFADKPDQISPSLGISTPEEAANLGDLYTQAGTELVSLTADENVSIDETWANRFQRVCDGEATAIGG